MVRRKVQEDIGVAGTGDGKARERHLFQVFDFLIGSFGEETGRREGE
jgi:hypothetical protein